VPASPPLGEIDALLFITLGGSGNSKSIRMTALDGPCIVDWAELPKFASCGTGKSTQPVDPSLASGINIMVVRAVGGWGQRWRDTDALVEGF